VVWGKPDSLQVTNAILVKSPVQQSLIATEQEESKTDKTAAGTLPDEPSKTSATDQAADHSNRKASAPKKRKNPTVLVSNKKDDSEPPPDQQSEEAKVPTPANSWISKTGDWSGAKVASRGCLSCHKDGILLMSKSEDEWQRFFLQEQHNRNENLNQYFSKQELALVLAYILRKIEKRKEAEQK
jgi:hypothetical protein